MKILQFIDKHSLVQMKFPDQWIPVMLLMDDERAKRSVDDQYEIYANADKTIWLSINATRRRFRVCFCDLVNLCSDWMNAEMNYELEPMLGVPVRGGS